MCEVGETARREVFGGIAGEWIGIVEGMAEDLNGVNGANDDDQFT